LFILEILTPVPARITGLLDFFNLSKIILKVLSFKLDFVDNSSFVLQETDGSLTNF